jgi:predicted DNA-binding protein YlxM (UPF0122 family)
MRKRSYKLTEAQRIEAVRLHIEDDLPITKIAEMFGVSKQNVSLLVNAKKTKEKYPEFFEGR